jgi:hypothetical protein
MHPNVVLLIESLPPPQRPSYNRGDWRLVERELGTRLPSDFQDFTEVYGAVQICDMLWFHTPFFFVGQTSYTPLQGEKQGYREVLLSSLRQMDAVVGGRENVPFPDYPAPGGLLPVGATENADLIAWITKGPPDQWGTFVWKFPGLEAFTFPRLNITGLLLALLSLESPLFPTVFDPDQFSAENRRVAVQG